MSKPLDKPAVDPAVDRDDPRPEWLREDREIEGRKPDLNETEEDTADL